MTLIPLTVGHRIGAAFASLIMFTMAYLQLNDPDPGIWVAMYSLLGAIGLLAVIKGKLQSLAWCAFGVAVLWALWLSPSVYELFMYHSAGDLLTGMSPDRPYVEESREALGLLIGAAAMLHLLLAKRAA